MLTRHYDFPPASPLPSEETSYTFLDIETTGLKRDATIVYLIGCGFHADGMFHIIQWFNDDGISEPDMLRALRDHLKTHPDPLFTFNGESFDIPYLNRHYELNAMEYRLPEERSLDLYRLLRPFRTLFQLPHGRQKDWESFLGIGREDPFQGGELIRFYKKYLRTKEEALLELLLLHNMEDIRGMEALLPLTACEDLLQGSFTLERIHLPGDLSGTETGGTGGITDEATTANPEDTDKITASFLSEQENCGLSSRCLTAVCHLRRPLPQPLRLSAAIREIAPRTQARSSVPAQPVHLPDAVLDAAGQTLHLFVPLLTGSAKYYYPDYKNYYYLPEEDRAIHASVGRYVDSPFREKAKPSTCYIRKEGVFLPFFPARSYKGIRTGQNAYPDTLPLYQREYKDPLSFVELHALLGEDPKILVQYLHDFARSILIARLRHPLT